MARDFFSNQGTTTVSSGGTSAPAAGTTESWTVASSSTFPAASNATNPASQFYISDPALPSETILVTNVNGTTWSVTRGADNTTPVAHTTGFTVRNVVSATWLQSQDDKTKYHVLNVKDYGAKGDNSTNDQPYIQAALDDAWKAGGAQVIIPRGIYRIMSAATSSSPLKIRSNTRLTLLNGAEIHRYANPSAASLVWSGDFSQGMAGFNGEKNILIEGGVWDMRNSSSTVALASDTFTHADTTAPHALGVMTTGQTWIDETSRDDGTSTSGNLGIATNTAYNPAASTGIATVNAWPDGTTSVVVSTVNTTGQTGLVFRLDDAQSRWQFTRDGASGNARLSYWKDSVETVITPTNTRAVAAGATLTVTCIGNRIITGVITSGTYAMSHDTTDAPGFTSSRKVGLVITDTTSRLDTFSSSGSIWADNFNRTSAVSLGTASSGYAWTAQSGTLGTIAGATAYAPGAGTNISTVDVTSECNPTVTVATTGTASAGLVFRFIDTSNYWYFIRNSSTGQSELGKVVAGVTTVISATTPTTVSAGGVLNVAVIGYEIAGYVGTTLTHAVNNDSANYAGTKAGIIINDTTSRLDSFDTPASWGGGTQGSGACFSFSHDASVTFRDLTVKDTHQNSHSIDMQGLRDTLVDNCRFLGTVGSQSRGAIQVDCSVNDGLPPVDGTSTANLLIRGCTVAQSYSAGTVAYARAFESHAGKVTRWYSSIRIVDNHIETTELGVKGYNWNYGVISNNVFASGWGMDFRVIAVANPTDTTNRAGTQTSASQLISGVTISGNVIDGTGNGSTAAAIRVGGETTGHISGATVTGNTILGTGNMGIEVVYVDHGTVSGNVIQNTGDRGLYVHNATDVTVTGNSVYNAGNHGIGVGTCTNVVLSDNLFDTSTGAGAFYGIIVDTCTDALISNNQSMLAGRHGIYVLAGSRIRLLNNYVYGASKVGNGLWASIKVDSTPDDVTVSGNTTRSAGGANEASYGFHCSTGTKIKRLVNDFHTGVTGDISVVSTGDVGRVIATNLAADVTGLTSLTYAIVTGLSIPINETGLWRVKAFLNFSQATAAGGLRFGIGGATAASSGPTATMINYSVLYQTAASTTTSHIATAYLGNTTNVTPAITTVWGCLIDGYIDVSATGTITIQYVSASASDAVTVKNGSLFMAEKVVG